MICLSSVKQINGEIGGKNLRKQIKETEYFQGLSKMLQKMFLKSNNMKRIVHALRVVENTSFEEWNSKSDYSYNSVQIIKELVHK